MNETTVNCPQCRQPVQAVIEQLFDVTAEPESKRRLLGRVSNYVRCQTCGYQGALPTPIVYHDNEKELLLTYFPSELGMNPNEQEKIVGPLIKKAMDRLPQEQRKAYFLRPQNFFTFQSMMEKILEKDGVTKEMIDEQQKQLALLQKLIEAPTSEARLKMIQEQESIVNDKFFILFERIAQSAIASGDKDAMQSLTAIQNELIENTTHGKKVAEELGEVEAAAKALQEMGESLTRESLLKLITEAPNDARLSAYVNMTRGGLDQEFFDLFNKAIESAAEEDKADITSKRDKVLEITKQMDEIMKQQVIETENFLEQLLQAPDIEQATMANLQAFNNDTVMAVLEAKVREAQNTGDQEKLDKFSKVFAIIQQASTPPEIELINSFVEVADQPDQLEKALLENKETLTEEVEQFTLSMIQQIEQTGRDDERAKDVLQRLNAVYAKILNMKMKSNLN